MTAEREMTLHEWVGKLPEIHLARKEFVAMQQRIATLEAELKSWKKSTIFGVEERDQRIAALEAQELGFVATLSCMETEAKRLRNRVTELEKALQGRNPDGSLIPAEPFTQP